MKHRVIAYSGSRHPQEPREFYVGEERHVVGRVKDTWLEERVGLEGMLRRVWRVVDRDGKEFLLTYYRANDFWEIEPSGGGAARHPEQE